MSGSSVQAQWSLSATAQAFISVARGTLVAATSDNVQVLAILACQRFGSTLAMSSEAIAKVEQIVVPSPEPAVVPFLKGLVGFFQHDCATQLGQNPAGTRFLALAAALTTSLGSFESAKALDTMLRSSTTDLTALPTVRHLKDLLSSLEVRSHRCGFVDSVLGWQILLQREALPRLSTNNSQRAPSDRYHGLERDLLDMVPSPEAIAGLVDVFRQIARVGPDTILGATIRVSAAAPWVLAFAQWCLETPSLYVANQEVLGQPGSRLKVVISSPGNDMGRQLEVTIHHQLENITQLLGEPSGKFISGMATIESYGAWLLRDLGLGFDDGMLRTLREALEHGIPQVLLSMECGQFTRLGRKKNYGRWHDLVDNFQDHCMLCPLPDTSTIAGIYARLLTAKETAFTSLKKGELIADLPLVSRHLKSLTEECGCEKCCENTQRHWPPNSKSNWCRKYRFYRSLSFIIMDILALSLFESSAPLLVSLSSHRDTGVFMEHNIAKVLMDGGTQEFDDMDLLDWARSLAGHQYDSEERSLILTYGKGQVIYPIVFDTLQVEKQGYLKLCVLPGTLRYQGERYDVVSLPDTAISDDQQPPNRNLPAFPAFSRPLHLFSDYEVVWGISVQDDKELHARLLLRSKSSNTITFENDPYSILLALKDTLFLESCPHHSRAELATADRFASFSTPWDDHQEALDSTSKVDVVAVDGANDLQCFALACTEAPAVLRGSSCIVCCLDVCREADIHVLIL